MRFKGIFNAKIPGGEEVMLNNYGGTIENEIFWNGIFNSWESDTGWIWIELSRISNVIFDIGANTGIYSVVAKSVNPNAEIHAFEPSTNTFQKLLSNNKINRFNIHCNQLAVSNNSGTQIFYDVYNTNQTSASLSPDKIKNTTSGIVMNEYEVKTVTLSDYIESKGIGKIDLVKLDIEMHEPEAIEGMKDYLLSFKPIIIIEVLNETIAAKLNNLFSDSFEIYHLAGPGNTRKMKRFEVIQRLWNYLVFHKDVTSFIKSNTTLFNQTKKNLH